MTLSKLLELSKKIDLKEELLEVWSADGWVRVLNVFENGLKQVYTYHFSEKNTLHCTESHKIQTTKGWKTAQNLKPGEQVLYDGVVKTYLHKEYRGLEATVDLEVEHNNHRFYCNGISVHNSKGLSYKHVVACDYSSRSAKQVSASYENLCAFYVQVSRAEESMLILYHKRLLYPEYETSTFLSKWLQKLLKDL